MVGLMKRAEIPLHLTFLCIYAIIMTYKYRKTFIFSLPKGMFCAYLVENPVLIYVFLAHDAPACGVFMP